VTLFDAGAPAPASTVVRLVVAYDGTDFHGFAAQPERRTVQGVLVTAIERALRTTVDGLTGAGRTDAGVHAWGQVVSFRLPPDVGRTVDLERFRHTVNRQLAPEIVVRSAERAEAAFDARRSACWRHYRYTVLNRPEPDPFMARHAWWIGDPLELSLLRLGADPFVGEHDFAAFCRKGPEGSTLRRRVFESRWVDEGDGALRYEIRANAFCWQMVRAVVGTLVDAGAGKRRPGEMMGVLRGGDRRDAGQLAPPRGLCLWEVGY
jgi:tRNA pseudouridine38-40 synthase